MADIKAGDTIVTEGKQGTVLETVDGLIVKFDEGILYVSADVAELVTAKPAPTTSTVTTSS